MATFAERLKSLRREKGWSQQRLADELRLSKSSVNMYERGEREPGFETMEAIADLFNVDMNYLYGRTDIRIADPIIPKPSEAILKDYSKGDWLQMFAADPPVTDSPEDKTALLEAFDKLNAEGRQKAVEYTEDLVLTGRYEKD